MKIFYLIILLCVGCTTTITTPDGMYKITGKSNEYVVFDDGKVKIESDRRGKHSFLETALGAILIKMPENVDINQ